MLLVSNDGISEVTEGLERELSEQEIGDLASRFSSVPVDIVLDDPAYVSASYPVEFRRRRERRILAESRFSELASEEGVGSWCIAPEGAGFRLYVLALDPGSVELSCLKKLAAEGVTIGRISSSLMLGFAEHATGDLLLRVVVRESCVQLALRCHGVCIFARRIESKSGHAKEAIETTLRYLQSQDYLEIPFKGVWELCADDQVSAELAGLWAGSEPMLPEPRRWDSVGMAGVKPTASSSFNFIGWQQAKPMEERAKSLLLVATFVASLMLAYVLSQQWFAPIEPPAMEGGHDVDVPEAVLQRFWRRDQIQHWKTSEPQTVADDLSGLLTIVHEQVGVSVRELTVDSNRSYQVSCSLGGQFDDPLLQRELHLFLRDKVAERLPEHRVSVRELDGHFLDSRQEESVFELVLELAHEPD